MGVELDIINSMLAGGRESAVTSAGPCIHLVWLLKLSSVELIKLYRAGVGISIQS